jgi:hypothetical protein
MNILNLQIKEYPADDPDFLKGLSRIISETVSRYSSSDVFLVRIDNWFDVKWFGFSGKAKVGIDSGLDSMDSEVIPFWKIHDEVTFPPFSPNRIIEQNHLKYKKGVLSPAGEKTRLVHPIERRRSSENLDYRVLDFCPSGLFIWYSSKSSSNGRASLMLYRVKEGKLNAWYVSFARNRQWRVDRVRNNYKEFIEFLFYGKTKKERTQQAFSDGAQGPCAR